MMTLNENIRRIRESQGISQRDFANKIKILNQSQISKIEKGTRKVSATELAVMARSLNVSLDSFIKGTPNQNNT